MYDVDLGMSSVHIRRVFFHFKPKILGFELVNLQ